MSQLSRVYLLMGELDKAETHAHQAREMKERPWHYSRTYPATTTLSPKSPGREARRRRRPEWEARRDEMQIELTRRARAAMRPTPACPSRWSRPSPSLLWPACRPVWAAPGCHPRPSPPLRSSNRRLPVRCSQLGHYLRRLATGPASDTVAALATPPAGLPDPLPQLIAKLRDAVREAVGG